MRVQLDRRFNRRRRAAFSLAEVLIAVTVVGLAMLPVFTTLSSANRGSADVENEALAVGLAAEAMEWARAIGFRGWCRALADSGRNLRLPAEVRVDAGAGKIVCNEPRVTSFKADDDKTEIDYPESSTAFSREIVMSFERSSGGTIECVRGVATVKWRLNVAGNPERRIQMEVVLHGGQP